MSALQVEIEARALFVDLAKARLHKELVIRGEQLLARVERHDATDARTCLLRVAEMFAAADALTTTTPTKGNP